MRPSTNAHLFDLLWDAGQPFGMALFGFRALITMRLEKNFGTWYREYRPIYTPLEAGMDRSLKFDHDFVGREALEAEHGRRGPARRLVMFVVEPTRGRSRRRDRRRADLARRYGRRLGDDRRLRPLLRACRWRSATSRPSSPVDGTGGLRDRDHRAAAVRRACSSSRCSIPPGTRMRS